MALLYYTLFDHLISKTQRHVSHENLNFVYTVVATSQKSDPVGSSSFTVLVFKWQSRESWQRNAVI